MQSNISFSMLLRELAADYYNHSLSFDEYRLRRRAIFDQIDIDFNGAVAQQETSAAHAYVSSVDGITGRGDSSDAVEPSSLGGTQAFSLQEVLDAHDKKN